MLPTTSESPELIAGKYQATALLGRGGMGKVYKATHTALGREVALKALHSELNSDPDFVKRFLREARAMGKLNHANIIRVFDMFEDQNTYYIAMELFEGKSLQQWVKDHGKPALTQTLHFISQAARGLAYAHAQGVIHRDIKPQNIFVNDHGVTKIGDFGIAATRDDSILTTTGQFFGSPRYMSPEQACGRATDQRSDLYSLAMVCYELVTGKNPFDNKLAIAIVGELVYEQSELRLDFPPDIPQDLQNLIRISLSKNPANRPQTTTDFLTALESVHKQITTHRANASDTVTNKSSFKILPGAARHHQIKQVKQTKRIGIFTKSFIALLVASSAVFVWQQRELIQETVIDSLPSNRNALLVETNQQFAELLKMHSSVDQVRLDVEKANGNRWAADTFESATILHNKAEALINAAQIAMHQKKAADAQNDILIAHQHLRDAKDLYAKAHDETTQRIKQNTAAEKFAELENLAAEVQQRITLAQKADAPIYQRSQFAEAQRELTAGEALLHKARQIAQTDTASAIELITESTGHYMSAADLFISAAENAKQAAISEKVKRKYAQWQSVLSEHEAIQQGAQSADARIYVPQRYDNAVKRSEQLKVLEAAIDKSMDSGNHTIALSQLEEATKLAQLAYRDYVELLAEAQTVKNAELEKAAKQQTQIETRPPERPTQQDIDTVERLLYEFEHAYENKNLDLLKMITDMSVIRLDSVEKVFNRYRSIDITINGYSVSGKQATAEIQITRLVNLDGTLETQLPWRTSRLLINKGHNGWQRITWE